MPRVLISAGHTMMDPGAIFGDLREADLTRKIAPLVMEALGQTGLEVKPVPLDLPLPDRIQWINDTGYSAQNGDILVEVHVNDADGSKRGLEIWYEGDGNNESEKLGVCIADAVVTKHGFNNQGVRSEQDHDLGSLRFLNATLPHAVIVELLYIDNAEDIAILKDENQLRDIAKSVATGIAAYAGKNLTGANLTEAEKPKLDELVSKYSTKPSGKKKPLFGGFGMNPFGSNFDLDDDLDTDMDANPFIAPTSQVTSVSPLSTSASIPSVPVNTTTATTNTVAPAAAPAATGSGLGASTFMDREKRKEMIEKTYEKVLGKKPEERDLNTYLNKGISETELTQKLIDSEEHALLIKAKNELDAIKQEQDGVQSKLTRLQTTLRDMQEMIAQLNRLLVHKNQALQNMERTFAENKGLPSQVFLKLQEQKKDTTPLNQGSALGVKLAPGVGEDIKRRFAKRFS